VSFFYFTQNNSGGYFIIDDFQGEEVVIEAESLEQAKEIFWKLPLNHEACDCCGDRWSDFLPDEKESLIVGGEDINNAKDTLFATHFRVHYLNGKIEAYDLSKPIGEKMTVIKETLNV